MNADLGRRRQAPSTARFNERLRVPLSWWAICLLVGLSFVTAVGWYLGPWFAAGATLVTLAGIVMLLGEAGRLRIVVDAVGLHVGPSVLEWAYAGEVRALDAVATRDRLGVDADARAFVASRPYLSLAVEVMVEDASDPHPYWLVSTRRPAALAAALTQGRASASEVGTAEP